MPERFRAGAPTGSDRHGHVPDGPCRSMRMVQRNLNVYLREIVARPKRFELLAF
jgi:hypothetical protein